MRLWLDEGHGGTDPGAIGLVKEKDWNLRISDAVERRALAQGWTVDRTRETDIFATLTERYKRANAWHADIFVSIHHDWVKAVGETIIFPNSNNAREETSMRLADFVNQSISAATPQNPNRGIYADRRGLAVLKGTQMPAIIVEAAGLGEQIILEPSYIEVVAEAIVRGIANFLGRPYVTPITPAPVPVPPVTPSSRPILRNGSTGGWVKTLQLRLNECGALPRLRVDGIFGDKTEAAVRAFQRSRMIDDDGIVGKDTWGQLYTALGRPNVVLRRGNGFSSATRILQDRLTDRWGYRLYGGSDGIFGGSTERAVRDFQAKHTDPEGNPLAVDGIVGPETWWALYQ